MNNSYNERSMKIIDLKKTILEDNDADADRLREELKKKNVFYMNVMSSPGSGKTTTIVGTIERLRKHFNIGVMEADIDSDVDALTVAKAGVPAVQLHTGGMCHLDADMSRQGMAALEAEADNTLDFIILENVGNLVCPAEFDTGACFNVAILSVPEGDDKPLKYPLMFEKCQAVIINKIDSMPAFDFDMDRVKDNIAMRNPEAVVFPVSARTGEGMDAWCEWLKEEEKTFMVNLMSSPGAGKTTTLLRTAKMLGDRYRIGVMEADIDSSVDAEKMAAAGITSIQVHTGGECAMDAHMTMQALDEFDTKGLDLLVMENVGNLVCPAETDTGASRNVVILSYPEGDDKPLKYPLMFEVCHVVLINKIDTKEYFDFDDEAVVERIHERNPLAKVFFVSAKTGEGFEEWVSWLDNNIKEWIGGTV